MIVTVAVVIFVGVLIVVERRFIDARNSLPLPGSSLSEILNLGIKK